METTLKLRHYLELRSKQLRLDLDAATLFVGDTEAGTVAEDAIRRFLESSLPTRYHVGLGEVISTEGQIARQTQAKDVIVYDSAYSPIFGWGETGFYLFPIESVYAIIEVKKTIDTPKLLSGIKQATEAKKLVGENSARPFTCVIAFNSRTSTATLARNVCKLPQEERVDFILILNPRPSSKDNSTRVASQSDYIAHWYYHTPGVGGGSIDFTTSYKAALEEKRITSSGQENNPTPHIYLTWGRSEHTLMWFYLFLINSIGAMELKFPTCGNILERIKLIWGIWVIVNGRLTKNFNRNWQAARFLKVLSQQTP